MGRIPLNVFSALFPFEVGEMTTRVWTPTFFLEVFSSLPLKILGRIYGLGPASVRPEDAM